MIISFFAYALGGHGGLNRPHQRPRPGRVFWNKIRKGERAPMPLGATGD